MKNFLSALTRNLYFIPGAYYIAQFISKLYPVPRSQDIKIIETPFKFKIKVDISKYMGNKIYWRGAHDWSTIFALQKNINPDDTIIDIGANIGEYTLYAASFLNEHGKVFAFEPVQKMFDVLNENIQFNLHLASKIITIKKGLGKQKELLPVFDDQLSKNNEGLFSLHQKNFQQPQKVENIEIDTLDNIVQQHKINTIHFIKIDVEGNELFVLQGAINTLQKHKPKLMIEISEANFNAAGYSTSDVIQYLLRLNYNIYLIQKRGHLKKIHSAHELPNFCNIMALP